MTAYSGIDHFATTVMARVNADGGPTLALIIEKGADAWQASPPQVVWEPTRDRFGPPQKLPRGSRGSSVATRMAGGVVKLWAKGEVDGDGTVLVTDTAATEALVNRVVRQMVRSGGPEPFFELSGGAWNDHPADAELGRIYEVTFALAVDIHLDPPTTTRPTSVALDTSRSTAGDGLVDAGEPEPAP